jgi:hypothetical protein
MSALVKASIRCWKCGAIIVAPSPQLVECPHCQAPNIMRAAPVAPPKSTVAVVRVRMEDLPEVIPVRQDYLPVPQSYAAQRDYPTGAQYQPTLQHAPPPAYRPGDEPVGIGIKVPGGPEANGTVTQKTSDNIFVMIVMGIITIAATILGAKYCRGVRLKA